VTDSFALVTSLANLELKQLGEAYVNVGGAAAGAGMSLNDVNAFLVEFSEAGEEVTQEDWHNFASETAYIRDMESATAAREYQQKLQAYEGIDFGANHEEAQTALKELAEYSRVYQEELAEAQKAINEEFAIMRIETEFELKHGKINLEEYQTQMDALNAANVLTQESYEAQVEYLQDEIRALGDNIKNEVEAVGNALDYDLNWFDRNLYTLGAIFHSWTNDFNIEDSFDRIVKGEVYKTIEEVDEVLATTDNPTIELDVAVSAEGRRVLDEFRRFGVRGIANIPIDGSNRDGLDYVPYDGYISELHRGERVLTAEENRVYSAPSLSPITYNNKSGAAITVNYSPAISSGGSVPADLEEILKRHGEEIRNFTDGGEVIEKGNS